MRPVDECVAGDVATEDAAGIQTDPSLEPAPLVTRLLEVHAAARERFLVSMIQDELKEMIGSDEPLDPAEPLLDMGLDSLMIVELRDRLQIQVAGELQLPATLVFDYPRIQDLASFLVQSLNLGDQRDHVSDSSSRVSREPTPSGADLESMSEQQALQELLRELDE